MRKIQYVFERIYNKFVSLKFKISVIREKYYRANYVMRDDMVFPNPPKVAIVVVNFNTKDLIALLLFSIFKNMGTDRVSQIVVVDNNSSDGSRELLRSMHDANLITLISNKRQRYHGPALNQAINYLNKWNKTATQPFRYIWLLDSDVVILKRNTLDDAIAHMIKTQSAVIGQFQDNGDVDDDYPHISSIIIDPYKTWNCAIHPFLHHGWPSMLYYRDVQEKGMIINDFPFMRSNYMLHIGSGTVNKVYKDRLSTNDFFKWSIENHHHLFHKNPDGVKIYNKTKDLFENTIGELTTENFVKKMLSEDVPLGILEDNIDMCIDPNHEAP